MQESEFQAILDEIKNRVRENFKSQHHIAPMCFLLCKKGMVVLPLYELSDKRHWEPAMKGAARQLNAFGAIHIAESWVAMKIKPEEVSKYAGRINEHPNSKEVVMISTEFCPELGAVQQSMLTAEIVREDPSVPKLSDYKALPFTSTKGRFTRILDTDRYTDEKDMN